MQILLLRRAQLAQALIDIDQLGAELAEAAEGGHFTLGLVDPGRIGERLLDGVASALEGQPHLGAVAGNVDPVALRSTRPSIAGRMDLDRARMGYAEFRAAGLRGGSGIRGSACTSILAVHHRVSAIHWTVHLASAARPRAAGCHGLMTCMELSVACGTARSGTCWSSVTNCMPWWTDSASK